MSRFEKRKRLSGWIHGLFSAAPRAGREFRPIRVEALESRQLMANDAFLAMLGSATPAVEQPMVTPSSTESLQGEGEAAQDLVGFAKAIAASGAKFYGAFWCPHCLAQKQLFQDGAQFLPYVEVTNPDRTPNATATSQNITQYPTWVFSDGSRLVGEQTLATLASKVGVAIPTSSTPSLANIPNTNVAIGAPMHVPVDAYDPNGNPLTVTVTSSNPSLVNAQVLTGNRSIRISVENFGDMVFQLFESEVPLPTSRIIELAQSGFYNNVIFHRVINNFVIQGGDPTGTGSGGSTLGDIDDQFNLNLVHNRSGILSYAKSSDDTNDSQFFITEGPQRHLDFNHSVFGQLIEGEAVRDAISNVLTNSSDAPTIPIKISGVTVFSDTENALVRLKAAGTGTGTATITVRVTDTEGNTTTQDFTATVVNDTANGTPFLNPVTNVTTAVNTPVTINLSSSDKESDAVTYSVTKLGTENFTVTVNPTTGVAQLTPPTGFVGTLQFRATVQQSASSTTTDKTDNQVISVLVGASVPTAIDLDTSSDSGASSTDNITNAVAPVFTVSGTLSGATVKLKVGNTVIGQAVATGTTTSITASNIASLGTGAVLVTATQTVNSVESGASPSVSVTFDTTAPATIAANLLPSTAQVGQALSVNLSHAEEGQGLVYAIENAPAGMTIDASTGALAWTPTVAQLGAQSFKLKLTDAAGNVTSQDVALTVAEQPKVKINLVTTDLQDNVITQIATGQQFKVRLSVQDLRGLAATGVFGVYTDLLFDSTIIEPIATSPITYKDPFVNGKSGSVSTAGLVDELGAFSSSTARTGGAAQFFAEVTFVAKAAGNPNLRTEAADTFGNDILLYDESAAIPAARVSYGTNALAVGANFQVANDVFNFDEDSGVRSLNVLANDTVTGTTTLTIASVGSLTSGSTLSIASDGKTLNYTPAANFNGAESFTYTVRNTEGVTLTGTVTIQVADVNDPPVGVNDVFTVSQNSTSNALDVLSNDTKGVDADASETLRVSAVGTGSAGGTLQVGSSGLNVLYSPKPGFTGTETFSYTLSDGRGGTTTATASITVKLPNPPPVAVADTFSITEDAAQASFDVLANDTTEAGETISISAVGTSTKGSTLAISSDGSRLLYKPGQDLSGQEVVTYTVRDSGGATAVGTVTFTIANTNDAPVANDDTASVLSPSGVQTINVIGNDTNPDSGETLTITAVTQPAAGNGSIEISSDKKSLRYTPPSNTFTGTASFSYTLSDGTLTDTANVVLTVNNYALREIGGKLFNTANSSVALGGVNLVMTGTDVTGASVQSTLVTDSSGAFKKSNAAPGSYTVSRPALPFLEDAGETLQVTSGLTDSSNLTLQSKIGGIKPQFVSIRDFLGSATLNKLTVAVTPGNSQSWYSVKDGFNGFSNIQAKLNSDATSLVVTAVNSSNQNVQATLPMSGSNSRVTVAAKDGSNHLLKIRGTASELGFTVVTTTNTSGASGEGESSSSLNSRLASSSNTLVGEGEAAPSVLSSNGLNSQTSSELFGTSALRALLGSSYSDGVPASTSRFLAATTQLPPSAVDGVIGEIDVYSSVSNDLVDSLTSDDQEVTDQFDMALQTL